MKKTIAILLTLILLAAALFGCCGENGMKNKKIDYDSYNVGDRIFMFKIWNFEVMPLGSFKKTVDAVKADGFNMIVVHLVWAKAETRTGKLDLQRYADMARYVLDQGMKVGFDVDLLRGENDGYLTKDEVMYSRSGKKSSGGTTFSKSQFSLCSETAVEKAVTFYKKVVQFMHDALGDDVFCYIPTMTQYAETEYWCADEYDYGNVAISAFKDWLKEKYGTTDEMNKKTGSDYIDFDFVVAPSMSDTYNPLFLDWYSFRHEKLKNVIDKFSEVQHEVAPNSNMAVQFGSVFDSAGNLRCTFNFPDLVENVQIVWIDDAPNYDHNFSVDYLRSNVPANVLCANEIDAPDRDGASPEAYFKQADESYKFGCSIVNVANWSINDNYKKYMPTWQEISGKWVTGDAENLLPSPETETLSVKLTDIIKNKGVDELRIQFNEISNSGEKFVWLRIEDDLK